MHGGEKHSEKKGERGKMRGKKGLAHSLPAGEQEEREREDKQIPHTHAHVVYRG